MSPQDVEDVILRGKLRPFRPLQEVIQQMNRQQRRAAARTRRRRGHR